MVKTVSFMAPSLPRCSPAPVPSRLAESQSHPRQSPPTNPLPHWLLTGSARGSGWNLEIPFDKGASAFAALFGRARRLRSLCSKSEPPLPLRKLFSSFVSCLPVSTRRMSRAAALTMFASLQLCCDAALQAAIAAPSHECFLFGRLRTCREGHLSCPSRRERLYADVGYCGEATVRDIVWCRCSVRQLPPQTAR
jgi:hypothetical protein